MAIAENADAKEVAEINEVISKSRPLFALHARARDAFAAFERDYRTFETGLVMLMNAERNFERRMKEAEARLADAERQARERLATMEHGHRTLLEDLNRKQLEADKVKTEAEATMRKGLAQMAEAVELRHMYERKISEVNSVSPKKK